MQLALLEGFVITCHNMTVERETGLEPATFSLGS